MKKLILSFTLGLLLSPCFAADIITDTPAKGLFKSLFIKGGDIFCSANHCSLQGHCIFDRSTDHSLKFICEINEEIVLGAGDSEGLFRDIFDASLTMDGNCSAHYCELTATCEYSRLVSESIYQCEIF